MKSTIGSYMIRALASILVGIAAGFAALFAFAGPVPGMAAASPGYVVAVLDDAGSGDASIPESAADFVDLVFIAESEPETPERVSGESSIDLIDHAAAVAVLERLGAFGLPEPVPRVV